jgi:hypothetical protein
MRRYVYGPGIGEPIVRIDVSGSSSARYYTHQDTLGSVVAVTDNTGAVVEKDGYGVYGESASLTRNPNRFTGRASIPRLGSITTAPATTAPPSDASCRTTRSGIKAGIISMPMR